MKNKTTARFSNSSKLIAGFSALGMAGAMLTGCDPVPRHTLTTEEKMADMYWAYAQFGENYAPLEYKQERYKFDYTKLKADYLEAAKQTRTNDEFYDLVFKFVSEFKDAHTGISLTNSSLPDRGNVAFLGFSGIRDGEKLLVKKLLPTIAADSDYPIKKGDKIIKINGKALADVVKENLVRYRDLGNDEANLTYHFNKIFTRVSTVNGLPAEKDATLTVERAGKEIQVALPWVLKDINQFEQDQEKAAGGDGKKKAEDANLLVVKNSLGGAVLRFNFIGFDGRIQSPLEMLKKVMAGTQKKFSDGFQFLDNIADYTLLAANKEVSKEGILAAAEEKTPMDRLSAERMVLDNAIYLSESKTFPAYVAPVEINDKDDKPTGVKKLVGYIYVDTFSPTTKPDTVLEEFKDTLIAMQSLGVKDLIIDTINNGGGSLVLGMQMAQVLTTKKIEMPKMKFRLSDSWLDAFEASSMEGKSDAEKEYSRRMLVDFKAQQASGMRLSQAYPAEIIAPFQVSLNDDLTTEFKTVLLVNEMCASMCDIFAGILQDNKMAMIVGTRSMGAGGNVVNHQQAPMSHFDLRQTESLILRKDGSYVENNGVTPDLEIAVNKSAKDKYDEVIRKAAELLSKKTE